MNDTDGPDRPEGPEGTGRAERAFRDALSSRAAQFRPGDLDPLSRSQQPTMISNGVRPASVRRPAARRWPLLVAAAIVLVAVAGGLGGVMIINDGVVSGIVGGGVNAGSGAEAGSGPVDNGGNAETQADQQSAPMPYGNLPRPDAGWRWVSWRNVAVQVPRSWPYDHRLQSDWCATSAQQAESGGPFVAIDDTGVPVMGIGCPDRPAGDFDSEISPAPDRLWRPHVALTDGSADLAPKTHKGWTLSTRVIDGVQVRVLSSPATEKFTDRILSSARTFDVDQNGCPATSPIQADGFRRPEPAFDVTKINRVDAISICRYHKIGTDRPGLSATRLITGASAERQLRAIQAAPAGGGPNAPQTCSPDDSGTDAVVLRLHSGARTRELYVYYQSCRGNGFDDGTTQRELTRRACAPIFAKPPLILPSASGQPAQRCMR